MTVRLTPEAARLFPDLAERVGTVLRMDGWAVVKWKGLQGEVRLPRDMIEEIAP
jgi:hypothetical protein